MKRHHIFTSNTFSGIVSVVCLFTVLSAPALAQIQNVHEAQHKVDEAWEIFHRAAVEGTLRSPEIQTRVEHELNEARALLAQAREAAEHNDTTTLQGLMKRIETLTSNAIEASQLEKPTAEGTEP